MKIRTVIVLIVWIAILLSVQIGYVCLLLHLPKVGVSWSDRGVFGDSFGALNAFISGCAFICLVVSLRQQEKQLADNQKDIEREITAMTAQATSSEKATAALTKQLSLMQLSSRLAAIPTLVEAELVHLEVHHSNELGSHRIRSMTHQAIKGLLAEAEEELKLLEQNQRDPSTMLPLTSRLTMHQPTIGHFRCFVQNLRALHEFKRDLFELYRELAKPSTTEA